MTTTMQLLAKALQVKRAAQWARDLAMSEAAFSTAKRRGRLSPTLAGSIAAGMNENPEHWIAIAALEAEPETPLRNRLMTTVEKAWQRSSLVKWLSRSRTHAKPAAA